MQAKSKMSKKNRVIFTREELQKNVVVDPVVANELQAIVEDHLKKCGIFYRTFSRIKSISSLANKFEKKEYGPNTEYEKVQDLIGIRIVLYFQSDLEICKKIMEDCFSLVDWSVSAEDTERFAPTKVNGVFQLPSYLIDKVSPETFEMWIDQTFEIQIKTIFFEGWHEVEHDMRYKNKDVWEMESYKNFARNFNSILATLELCDNSIETTLEDLAHNLYKNGDYDNMMRMHYRLKFNDQKLYQEIIDFLNHDKENGGTIAKKLFKAKREELVGIYFKQKKPDEVSVNKAIELLNDKLENLQNPELAALIKKCRSKDSKKKKDTEKKSYAVAPLEKLSMKPTFRSEVEIQLNEEPKEIVFKKISEILYNWLYVKYVTIFDQLPKNLNKISSKGIEYTTDGFNLTVSYDEKQNRFHMRAAHIATNVIGRIYVTEANLYIKRDKNVKQGEEKFMFQTFNSYRDYNQNSDYEKVANFSYPTFYKEICRGNSNMWSVVDGVPMRNEVISILSKKDIKQLQSLIQNQKRQFPVFCIVEPKNRNKSKKSWISEDWIADINNIGWCYAHFFKCNEEVAMQIFGEENKPMHIESDEIIMIYPRSNKILRYAYDDVINCKYNWRIGYERDEKIHNILIGKDAFKHVCINQLKLGVLQDK